MWAEFFIMQFFLYLFILITSIIVEVNNETREECRKKLQIIKIDTLENLEI